MNAARLFACAPLLVLPAACVAEPAIEADEGDPGAVGDVDAELRIRSMRFDIDPDLFACRIADPSKSYVSRDPEQCAAMSFLCAESMPFFDDCGCGCQVAEGVSCGEATCGAGEECCNPSCGICVEPGGACTQQLCGEERL